MDRDNELARAKWLLGSGVLFLASCFACYSEMVYLLSGHKIDAAVTEAYEVTHRTRFGMSQGKALTVEYRFAEPDGTQRTGSDTVASNWDLPPTGTIPVQYTPGAEGRSRLAGHINWLGIWFFFVSIGVLAFFGYRLWREAVEATRPSKPKRRIS